jgi:hypothetical protein
VLGLVAEATPGLLVAPSNAAELLGTSAAKDGTNKVTSKAFHSPIRATFDGTNDCYFSGEVAESILGDALIAPVRPFGQGSSCQYVTSEYVMSLSYTEGSKCTPDPGSYTLTLLPGGGCITSARGLIWVTGYSAVGGGIREIVQYKRSLPTASRIAVIRAHLVTGARSIVRLIDSGGGQNGANIASVNA